MNSSTMKNQELERARVLAKHCSRDRERLHEQIKPIEKYYEYVNVVFFTWCVRQWNTHSLTRLLTRSLARSHNNTNLSKSMQIRRKKHTFSSTSFERDLFTFGFMFYENLYIVLYGHALKSIFRIKCSIVILFNHPLSVISVAVMNNFNIYTRLAKTYVFIATLVELFLALSCACGCHCCSCYIENKEYTTSSKKKTSSAHYSIHTMNEIIRYWIKLVKFN